MAAGCPEAIIIGPLSNYSFSKLMHLWQILGQSDSVNVTLIRELLRETGIPFIESEGCGIIPANQGLQQIFTILEEQLCDKAYKTAVEEMRQDEEMCQAALEDAVAEATPEEVSESFALTLCNAVQYIESQREAILSWCRSEAEAARSIENDPGLD